MKKSEKIIFEKLTPISDSDLGIYENALDFVFENEDVKNVAVSGAYGAGKSSVLESYKKKHQDKKYVHISLAHFSDNAETDGEDSIRESVLEGKILNQLIHQIPSDRIPQTNFRVKKGIKRWPAIASAFIAVVFSFVLLNVIFFSKWVSFVNSISVSWIKSVLAFTATPETRLISGLVAIVIAAFCIYKLVQVQQNRHILRKLNVQGSEIEIFEKTEESYFDKYLNEVLYLFENVDADVIVFEDMDRFDANRIFERLREVNTLTNLQRKKDNKKVLRFFYLLRDDIFVSKDRTKFFDYIVPIVPVVDGSNSYDQFLSHLKKNDLTGKFDERFLHGISLYVDDMRLLKNICNEFLVYYNRLNTTELDYNKMLAMITYKNLFPRDYSDLQLGKGFVDALFEQKDKLLQEAQGEYESKISEMKTVINQAKQEQLESISELNIIDAEKAEKANRDYYNGQKRKEYDVWKHQKYPKRKAAIENRSAERMQILEQELTQLQLTQQRLHASTLKELIRAY